MTSVYTRIHGRKFSSTASPHARAQKLCGAGRLVLIPINEGRGTQPEVEPHVCVRLSPVCVHGGTIMAGASGERQCPPPSHALLCSLYTPGPVCGVPGAYGQCLPGTAHASPG